MPDNLVYHGSAEIHVTPAYGRGQDTRDYGRGFYTTQNMELAKEWAACMHGSAGYVHTYAVDWSGLSVLDFHTKYDILTWLALLLRYRDVDNTRKYKVTRQALLSRYYDPAIDDCDVIVGYRADNFCLACAKHAVRDEIDLSLLREIMQNGELGSQVFFKTEKAIRSLKEVPGACLPVDCKVYGARYDRRDAAAKKAVFEIMESERNTLTDTISKYL